MSSLIRMSQEPNYSDYWKEQAILEVDFKIINDLLIACGHDPEPISTLYEAEEELRKRHGIPKVSDSVPKITFP